ncbi:aminoacyl-tRNA hydrolase [Marvinbryantia formatexigens DSM 14469]|uniref:Peptidyl-tRNA hydrolase n=1 Tax=Marvinbryantia formatexigens DSM 14469 TaxID=478749 RepID=C6LDP7_9FIRM|nr:aminoacyl-tRNA hydrolase [Marvinbryantia formatexigens]EET61101.1 aminoacyl-tRNA hydrolase [Marvinbryantia formatexigens DSM 14469]UWO23685.1 aminoacyl-tRNA hydrolase [Marvinbryantia formatexigens DSM 14469]SDF66250.1 peptidyl-tRNA hydrolase, PTH1 family [Marvinbryantia formatexigens]
MYIIAGLGNPGRQYAHTRHNVGFDTIDVLAEKYNIKVEYEKGRALTGSGRIEGQSVLLVKPLTFMNLSGESIRALADFYKIDGTSQLIVIYDDISLPPGQLRIREKGSAGGHNGIKSIISHLGGQEFLRIKVGVGEKPAGWDLADYVLSRFSQEERQKVEEALKRAADAAVCLMTDGVEAAMNEYNRKVSE